MGHGMTPTLHGIKQSKKNIPAFWEQWWSNSSMWNETTDNNK